MQYYKLIALQINDFCSSVFFENNYTLENIKEARRYKTELEENGYICLLIRTISNIQI